MKITAVLADVPMLVTIIICIVVFLIISFLTEMTAAKFAYHTLFMHEDIKAFLYLQQCY